MIAKTKTKAKTKVFIKRVYERPSENDGKRILVDRLWPRGLTKEEAHLDMWLRNISPSTELRTWFNHDPQKWNEFQKKYKAELHGNEELQVLHDLAASSTITLVYAAKDEEHNNAVVLHQVVTADFGEAE